MKKKTPAWLIVILLTIILIVPGLVFANNGAVLKNNSSPLKRLSSVAIIFGPFSETTTETSVATIVGLVVNVGIMLLGVIFLVLTIYAGIKWMLAQGNESQVKEAQSSIARAATGLVIIISSYAVWSFIQINFLSKL